MAKILIRIISFALGLWGGLGLKDVAIHNFTGSFVGTDSFALLFALGGGIIGLFIVPLILDGLRSYARWVELRLGKTPTQDIAAGAIGIIVGLLIAALLTLPLSQIPGIGGYIPIGLTLLLGYLGMHVAVSKKEELLSLFVAAPRPAEKPASAVRERDTRPRAGGGGKPSYKLLDTSVIIDGRIADIARSGFLDGVLLVPGFVLEELQRIADSQDILKRNRGRRGLDILNKMQKDPTINVQIYETGREETLDVDGRLVRLARFLGAKIITNDYNLNKVAELRGVDVLNINELANALKPIVLPGEEMTVHVVKDGKEQGQGVAYLDDGTMIVVDGGRRYIGEQVGVMVTSVLQTAAGRMIFAKPKAMERAL